MIREIKGKHFIVNDSREFNSLESFRREDGGAGGIVYERARVSVCEVASAKFAYERIREREREKEKRARAFDRPRRILRRFHRLIESSAPCCDRDRIVHAREHAHTHHIASIVAI